jgi:hypothetical protein
MDPRFPIGRFDRPSAPLNPGARAAYVDEIERMPSALRALTAGLTDRQLDTPYRQAGWTVRQVVHHLPESHMNAYVRFKLALTEDTPLIKTYEEARWAELPDATSAPIGMSLDLLDALHRRWVTLLRSLTPAQFERTYRHPELGVMTLDAALALYAWHGTHHTAHVRLVAAK